MEVVLKDITYWDNPASNAGSKLAGLFSSEKDSRGVVPQLRTMLLHNVSMVFSPGTVTALHGYGKGPSALLSVVSARQSVMGQLTGSLLYDSSVRSAGSYCDIARCSSISLDYLFDLSVYEYLFWAARLRVTVSVAECRYVDFNDVHLSLLI